MITQRILRNCRLARRSRSYQQLTPRPPVSAPLPSLTLIQEKEKAWQSIADAARVAERDADETLLSLLVPLLAGLKTCRTSPQVRGIMREFDLIMKRTPNRTWALSILDDMYADTSTTVHAMHRLAVLEHEIMRSSTAREVRQIVFRGQEVCESQRLTCLLHF